MVSPLEVKRAYNISLLLEGKNQVIGLIEYDNFVNSDVYEYARGNGVSLNNNTIKRIYVNHSCE